MNAFLMSVQALSMALMCVDNHTIRENNLCAESLLGFACVALQGYVNTPE